jgi:ribosomal protein S18 acetylase RimI-like enzyme
MTINYDSLKKKKLPKIYYDSLKKKKLPEIYYDGIKRLLILTDHEFYPPLSSRVSTTQEHFRPDDSSYNKGHSISLYLQALLEQSFIIAIVDSVLVGFLSYIKDHIVADVNVLSKNVYVSTICVDPEYRRRGITSCFYDALEADTENHLVYTRTWNQNHAHINLLLKRKYEIIREFINDRDSGINTVYYAKRLDGLGE